jgi:hypothetical protein
LPPTTILSFSDQELAALRSAAAALLPQQRDQFLKDVAHELKRYRKIEPGDRTGHTVEQVARMVANCLAVLRTRHDPRAAPAPAIARGSDAVARSVP